MSSCTLQKSVLELLGFPHQVQICTSNIIGLRERSSVFGNCLGDTFHVYKCPHSSQISPLEARCKVNVAIKLTLILRILVLGANSGGKRGWGRRDFHSKITNESSCLDDTDTFKQQTCFFAKNLLQVVQGIHVVSKRHGGFR